MAGVLCGRPVSRISPDRASCLYRSEVARLAGNLHRDFRSADGRPPPLRTHRSAPSAWLLRPARPQPRKVPRCDLPRLHSVVDSPPCGLEVDATPRLPLPQPTRGALTAGVRFFDAHHALRSPCDHEPSFCGQTGVDVAYRRKPDPARSSPSDLSRAQIGESACGLAGARPSFHRLIALHPGRVAINFCPHANYCDLRSVSRGSNRPSPRCAMDHLLIVTLTQKPAKSALSLLGPGNAIIYP